MKNKALDKLRGHSIVNAFNLHYPGTKYISMNTTELHIQIYKLVDEYISLYADYQQVATPTTKGFISNRMEKIERELTSFWIVPESQMIAPRKENDK